MILQETIDKVLGLNIKEVISNYIDLKRSGSNWKGLSNLTSEKTPSFMVSEAKGIFKCFSSGKGGNVISFIMETEHYAFPEAVKHLCNMYAIPFLETEKTNEEVILAQRKESLYIITSVANEYYKANLKYLQEAYDYAIKERQFTPEIIDKFEIGFGPNTLSGLTNHLINNGYNWQMAVEASVLAYLPEKNKLYDKFRNRIMFPVKNITGNIVGFGGRSLLKADNIAKYMNSSDSIIYNKSENLYGIFESKTAIVKADECLLSEGYVDVIMFHLKQVEHIVASAGTSLTVEQVKLIKKLTKNVTIMFDGDEAGIRAALRGIDILLTEGMHVKVLILPEKQDPDDFAKTRTKIQIEDYIQANKKDFVMFKLNYLLEKAKDDFGMKSNAIKEVMVSVSKIPDPIQKEVYLRECARMTEFDIDVLRKVLKEITKEETEFSSIVIESFQEQSFLSKKFLQDQCEKKIIQYILAYGYKELNFKEIELVEEEFRGEKIFEESIVCNRRKVIDKVIYELENDGIELSNVAFAKIFEIAKTADLSDVNSFKGKLSDELFLLSQELRGEELAMHSNYFLNTEIVGSDVVEEELIFALEKSINESLLFYKTIFIERLIDEESRKEVPDVVMLSEYINLMVKIKKELNFI